MNVVFVEVPKENVVGALLCIGGSVEVFNVGIMF